jgi:hypothetical protein
MKEILTILQGLILIMGISTGVEIIGFLINFTKKVFIDEDWPTNIDELRLYLIIFSVMYTIKYYIELTQI